MNDHPPASGERSDAPRAGGEEAPPPILGSWRALYAAVIGELLLVLALCRWLTGWGR
jgi:hypothetical protein